MIIGLNYITSYLFIFVSATERICSEDIEINGISLRAGMQIQANMRAVHMDPELWGPEDPALFVPERYLLKRFTMRFLRRPN